MTPGFDVALALRRIAMGFWHDFAPIVGAGFVLVTLPQVALMLAGTGSGATVVATLGGLLRVLFVVIVSFGAGERLAGRPLDARAFVPAGFAASPRAIGAAMLLGAGGVTALAALLVADLAAGPAAPVVRIAIGVTAFAAAALVAPAVPLALATHATPVGALLTAVRLTRGRRGGIAAVLGVMALTLGPPGLIVAAMVYGPGASAAQVAATNAASGVLSPGVWLVALVDLLRWGMAAVVPAVVFAGLPEG